MNKKKITQKTNAPQLWFRWGAESQVILIFSALAVGTLTSVNAQSVEVADGVTQTTPVLLDGNGEVLNNNGNIVVNGVGTTAVDSSANNTVINNGSEGGVGIVSGSSRAVDVTDGSGATINNAQGSTILATGDQRNGTVYVDGDADNVTLNNDGSIDASNVQGAGVSVELRAEGTNLDINNSGTIAGGGTAGAGLATAGDGIRLERTRVNGALDATTSGLLTGDIRNSGTIDSEGDSGTTAGVRFVNGVSFSGAIENEEGGTISGIQNGLYFGNATPAGGGDFTGAVVNNAGTISSGSRALNIDGTGLEVNNTGEIIGTGDQRNGTVYADSTAQDFTLNNDGVIDAGVGNLGAGFSTELSEEGNNFDINNTGTIQGRGTADAGAATAGDGLRFERTRVDGVLDATTSGLFTGDIRNSGTIDSEGNSGTTAGVRFVNGVSFSGTIENEAGGTISGVQNGLYFGNATPAGGGDFTGAVVNNAGTISSGSRALNIDGAGLVVNNSGEIIGTGDQRNGTVYADSTAQDFTLNNDGVIDAGVGNLGAGFSTELSEEGNNFDINNTGTIQGRGTADAGAATAGDGLRFERTRVDGALDATTSGLFTGDIRNSGTIDSEGNSGTTAGVRFVNGVSFSGTIENEEGGTISGVQNGLYFGNATPAGGGDFTGAVVNNAGTISSGSRALNIDGAGLVVNNSGEIIGTGDQRNGTAYFDATANNATLNNLEGGLIDAGVGNQGSGISIQSGDGARNQTIVNDGFVIGRGGALASGATAGIRAFGSSASIADIDITNGANGRVVSETSAGILLEGITFTGSIQNSGDITGATAAIDTRSALGNIAIDQLDGNLNGGVLTGAGNDELNISGNSNLSGLIDLGAGSNEVNVLAGGVANITGDTIANSDLNVNGTLAVALGTPLDVDGTTTFAEGGAIALSVGNIADVSLAGPNTVLTSDAVIGGQDAVLQDNSVLLDFAVVDSLSPAANSLEVEVANADLAQELNDGNVVAFGQALQAEVGAAANPEIAGVISQLDGAGVDGFEALSAQLLPDLTSGVTREFYENQSNIFNSIERKLAQPTQRRDFWFEALGRSADRDGGANATDAGYDSNSFGFILGYDQLVSDNLVVGAALSYSDIEVDAGFNTTDIDAYSLNLYGQYTEGNYFVRGALGYSFGDAESDRGTQFGDIDSDFDLDQFSANISVGFDKTIGKSKLSPFASLQYAHTSRDSFAENGGLGLSVSGANVNVLELGAGIGHEIDFKLGSTPVKLVSRVGYYYELLDDEGSASASFNGGSSFGLDSASLSQGSLEFATGLGFDLSDSATLSVGYEGNYASDFDSHTGYLRFTKEF